MEMSMAEQKVWVGSIGPLLYDDIDPIDDEDGSLPGTNYGAIVTTGQLHVGSAPTISDNVIRMADVGSGAYQTYLESTFTLSSTGLTTVVTVTCRYVRLGNLIIVHVPSVSGTSNANTFTLEGFPTELYCRLTHLCVGGADNGINDTKYAVFSSSSTVTLRNAPNVNNTWTPSGFKSVYTSTYALMGI
jgi:hypothetical protein